ncbi:MAG: glycoside hydrolase family 95 protein, partial [Tannerella sp.]|nr:glycoside hydrolase family 95 protein [Tannerella sp.]
MKRISTLVLPAICLALQSCSDNNEIAVNQVSMNWQYDVPGTKFWEGLPVGTGRFGAMIPGAIADEVIAFNDETLWTGGPYNPNNPEGPKALAKIREYAFANNWEAATGEAWKLGTAPRDVESYRPKEGRPSNLMHPSNPIGVQFYQAMA